MRHRHRVLLDVTASDDHALPRHVFDQPPTTLLLSGLVTIVREAVRRLGYVVFFPDRAVAATRGSRQASSDRTSAAARRDSNCRTRSRSV